MKLCEAILAACHKYDYREPNYCLAMTHRERTLKHPRRRARYLKNKAMNPTTFISIKS